MKQKRRDLFGLAFALCSLLTVLVDVLDELLSYLGVLEEFSENIVVARILAILAQCL